MRSRSIGILALFLLASLLSSAASAQPADNNAGKPDPHLFNFGRANPSCQQWSDGCRVCTSAGCSNIGIACQPAEVKCIMPADAQTKGQ
jgi:hypothetical protein